jgi:hypothetical protein
VDDELGMFGKPGFGGFGGVRTPIVHHDVDGEVVVDAGFDFFEES